MPSSDAELISSTLVVVGMCINFALGWLCHEMGGK